MNERRRFLKLASAAAIPAAAGVVSSGVARADDGSVKEFLGAWNTIHTLPFPPFPFREFLRFADGGVMHETNSFLHTTSNLDIGLPDRVENASDGVGNWERVRKGVIRVTFRKMLFDAAHQNQNFGDLFVTGTLQSNGATLTANWHITIVDPLDNLLVTLGDATSTGVPVH